MHFRFVIFAICAARASCLAQARTPTPVAVVGNDYAFVSAPATLPPGEAVFSFENRGKVRHELSLALLNPGVTLQDVIVMFNTGGRRRDVYQTSIGVLLAFPAETAGGRLLATLLPGRTYAIICSLRDAPEAQPHAMLGMITAFTVTGKTP